MPIGDYTDDAFKSDGSTPSFFRQKLFMWNDLIGIRDNPVTESQENFMVDFLVNEYAGLTFSEIELAFRMNMLEEFGTVIEHFNKFDVRFLSQIVNVYKKKRLEADKKYQEICQKMNYLPAPVEDPELADYHSGRHVYLKYKQWAVNGHAIGLHADFKFLVRIGILHPEEKQMEEAISLAQQGISNQIEEQITDMQQIGSFLGNELLLAAELEDRAKSFIVMDLFKKIKSDNVDFQALLRSHLSQYHKDNTSPENTNTQTQKSNEPTSNTQSTNT